MQKTLGMVVGAAFGIVLVATCGGKMAGPGDAGAQSGPARMLTADTDANQLQSGMLILGAGTSDKVLDGPFVLSDARAMDAANPTVLYTLPLGHTCSIADQAGLLTLDGSNGRWVAVLDGSGPPSVPGGRIFIGASETLCAAELDPTRSTHIGWSGFRPY